MTRATMGRPVRAWSALAAAVLLVGSEGTAWAVDKDKAQYVGGTLSTVPQSAQGMLGTTDPHKLLFVAEKGGGMLRSPTPAWRTSNTARRWDAAGSRPSS
jgi:hypothetical protein